eukprot:3376564-Prymnesium_polylepis.1
MGAARAGTLGATCARGAARWGLSDCRGGTAAPRVCARVCVSGGVGRRRRPSGTQVSQDAVVYARATRDI